MGRDSEDKAGRILSIYTRLKQGKVIYKQEESIRYGVAVRTIQRDITDIFYDAEVQHEDIHEQEQRSIRLLINHRMD